MFWPRTLTAAEHGVTSTPATRAPRWHVPAWPNSLANRTLLTLLVGLVIVQAAGLTIHALDRIELQRFAELRDIGIRAMSIYRSAVATSVGERVAALKGNGSRAGRGRHHHRQPAGEAGPHPAALCRPDPGEYGPGTSTPGEPPEGGGKFAAPHGRT